MALHQIFTRVGGVLTPLAVLRERVLVFYDGLFFDTEPTIDIATLTYDESIADTVSTGVGYEDAFSDNTPTVTIV
jgi:hypothetical protein